MTFKNTVILLVLVTISCGNFTKAENTIIKTEVKKNNPVPTTPIVGANQTEKYLPLLKGKHIGIVANQTSVIFKKNNTYTHLVDSLQQLQLQIKCVFAPEHGFRGTANAGEHVTDTVDLKTGIQVLSIYGDNKKPTAKQLKGIDIMIFDIQDVGARFYTYISTLHYIMEACAEMQIPVLILDRPNPNGDYIDGPTLSLDNQSFVGMHPIPVVHGMSIGEYAKMINGEKWLKNGIQCKLNIIPVMHYNHNTAYSLPISPSPNLPNDKAINLYPSLCFFEGTNVNAGRGTAHQFQVFGSPYLNSKVFPYSYTPIPNAGAKHPKHENTMCYGKNLINTPKQHKLNLEWLIEAYQNTSDKTQFFNPFFVKLAGTKTLQQQIESGTSITDIEQSWQKDLAAFKLIRNKYLIYQP